MEISESLGLPLWQFVFAIASRDFAAACRLLRPHFRRCVPILIVIFFNSRRSLHFMPPDGMSGRTTSFHVSKIRSCSVSRRSAVSFKIVVNTKRYDFETDSPERAREIVARIRQAVEAWRVEHSKPLFLTSIPTQDPLMRR